MGYILRDLDAQSKFSQEVKVTILEKVVSETTVNRVLDDLGVQHQRERKFSMRLVVMVCIAMGLYAKVGIGDIIYKVMNGLRYVWDGADDVVPNDSAFTYRRYQLRARPVIRLFEEVCRPMATPDTPGAFLFGRRLMAIDSTCEVVPDTPANAAAFGKPGRNQHGEAAYPQVRGVYLVECGTHAIVGASFWPGDRNERAGAFRLMPLVADEMLVMWDRGFHDFDLFQEVLARGAHVLARLPGNVKPRRLVRLEDGSHLAYIYPSEPERKKRGEHLLVRLIDYTITEPGVEGYGEKHVLVTTMLDPDACPAVTAASEYHQRWEIELVIDEIDDHQRLAGRPLRSQKPVGVIQELYGLLIAHYCIRKVAYDAAMAEGIDPDRISFTHTLETIIDLLPEFEKTADCDVPKLYARLLRDAARGKLPPRRLRFYPRVVKRQQSKFPCKRPHHHGRRIAPDRTFADVVALI